MKGRIVVESQVFRKIDVSLIIDNKSGDRLSLCYVYMLFYCYFVNLSWQNMGFWLSFVLKNYKIWKGSCCM